MNKRIVKATVISIITIGILMFAGCRKCYDCFSLSGHFLCIKNADTLRIYAEKKQIHDTLTVIMSQGFVCDTSNYGYHGYGDLCGSENYNAAIAQGDQCYIRP